MKKEERDKKILEKSHQTKPKPVNTIKSSSSGGGGGGRMYWPRKKYGYRAYRPIRRSRYFNRRRRWYRKISARYYKRYKKYGRYNR